MGSIIFVHGTGVRENTYNEYLKQVRSKLEGHNVISCYWGGDLGTRLPDEPKSVPKLDARQKNQVETVSIWEALYGDPFYEIRLLELRTKPKESQEFVPDSEAITEFEELVAKLKVSPNLISAFSSCRLGEFWESANRHLLKSGDYQELISKLTEVDTTLREIIARALVAKALSLREEKHGWLSLGGKRRGDLVDLIVNELGGRDQSIGKEIKSQLFTWWARRNRAQHILDGYSLAGDILLYQTADRGQAIRDRIKDCVISARKKYSGSVILLAHSLGGIASVDLLAEQQLPVDCLITVGSQAPFLYEINALSSRKYGEALPDYFPKRWLNIYDQRDFLSYLAAGVFPNQAGVEDFEVNNDEPFPAAHSAYWENEKVWNLIRKEMI